MNISCPKCSGTGLIHDQPCQDCGGDGELNLGDTGSLDQGIHKMLIGAIAQEIIGKVDTFALDTNIFHSHQLWEAILNYSADFTEYLALSAANRETLVALLGIGVVPLTDSSSFKTILWAMFTPGTDARANLEALLT